MTDHVSVPLARRLREAGLRWTPQSGDRFMLPDRNMDEDVFVLADMMTDVHEFPTGPVIGFNGTVEWALDSIEQRHALWLPLESQLRDRLGGTFVALERDDGAYRVRLRVTGRVVTTTAPTAADAYARALLHLITGSEGDDADAAAGLAPRVQADRA